MTARHKALWLTLHEPRTVTAGFVLAYLVIAWGGVGALTVDHGILPVGVWSARIVSGGAFLLGGLVGAPASWRGIWWAEQIGLAFLLLGVFARCLAIVGMGDALDEGTVVFSLTAWVALAVLLVGRFLWVRISPYRADAGPIPAELSAKLARARIEKAEDRGRDA